MLMLSRWKNGLKFNIDWLRGQKTGFFIDQRENRSLLEKYAAGRDLLNMFCYTGGFSVYAMRVAPVRPFRRQLIQGCDVNRREYPPQLRRKILATSYAEDAFKFLKGASTDAYDLIVLDPPAFANTEERSKCSAQG